MILPTTTISTSIDAPIDQVTEDLIDPATHPEWATEFFSGRAVDAGDGTYRTTVPRMGGAVRMQILGDTRMGVIDLYLAPEGAPFGPPLPVRVVPNADGVDVLFTLTRFPDTDDDAWREGLESMARELEGLKARHENQSAD